MDAVYEYNLYREDRTEFEQEFLDFITETYEKFEKQKEIIYGEMLKLELMSIETGIPAHMNICGLSFVYTPEILNIRLKAKDRNHPYVRFITKHTEKEDEAKRNDSPIGHWYTWEGHDVWITSYEDCY
jgi:hypothetical protein